MSKITINESEQTREIQLLRYGTVDPTLDDVCNDKELIVGIADSEPTLYLGHAPIGDTVKLFKVILEKDLPNYEAIYQGTESNIIYLAVDNAKRQLTEDVHNYVEFTILGKNLTDYKIIKRKLIYEGTDLKWSEDDIVFQTTNAEDWACTEELDTSNNLKFTSEDLEVEWKIKIDNLITI